MQDYPKYCSMDVLFFFRIICKKKKISIYILKPFREIGQSVEESLPGGKLVLSRDLNFNFLVKKVLQSTGPQNNNW